MFLLLLSTTANSDIISGSIQGTVSSVFEYAEGSDLPSSVMNGQPILLEFELDSDAIPDVVNATTKTYGQNIHLNMKVTIGTDVWDMTTETSTGTSAVALTKTGTADGVTLVTTHSDGAMEDAFPGLEFDTDSGDPNASISIQLLDVSSPFQLLASTDLSDLPTLDRTQITAVLFDLSTYNNDPAFERGYEVSGTFDFNSLVIVPEPSSIAMALSLIGAFGMIFWKRGT